MYDLEECAFCKVNAEDVCDGEDEHCRYLGKDKYDYGFKKNQED